LYMKKISMKLLLSFSAVFLAHMSGNVFAEEVKPVQENSLEAKAAAPAAKPEAKVAAPAATQEAAAKPEAKAAAPAATQEAAAKPEAKVAAPAATQEAKVAAPAAKPEAQVNSEVIKKQELSQESILNVASEKAADDLLKNPIYQDVQV
jgi:hypothetical protein